MRGTLEEAGPVLRWHHYEVGAPSFAALSRRVGRQTDRTIGFAFTLRLPETKSSPDPDSHPPSQVRPYDRNDNCSSANPLAPAPVSASPDCGAYTAVSPLVSSPSKPCSHRSASARMAL